MRFWFKGKIRFEGDYSSWHAAARESSGYSDPAILAKTRAALLKVRSNEAAFERDSVLFYEPEYSFPLLSGLFRAAAVAAGKLSVLDFGGALGSTYFQNKPVLSAVKNLTWSVVEQAQHVECGRSDFADGTLRFYDSPSDCVRETAPNVLLLSSVLQYLPDPYGTLNTLLEFKFPFVIVDRTAFIRGEADRLTVQTVPDWIYKASYPAWFFNEIRFRSIFSEQGYGEPIDFICTDRASLSGARSYFKGFIFDRRETSL